MPYDNVSYVFINVFIFKICMGCEMDRKPSARYNNMVKKYILTRWDLLGLAPLDETDVFFFYLNQVSCKTIITHFERNERIKQK